MRLAIVCDGYWDQLQGGAEYQLHVIGEALSARGWEVHYIYRDRGTPISPTPMHLHPMRLHPFVARLFYPYHPLMRGQLYRSLERIRPDVILNRVGNALTGLCARYGRKRGVPVVWHVASIMDLLPFEPPRNRTLPMALWDRRLLEHGIRCVDRVVAQADYQAETLFERWGRRADLVFPNVHAVPPPPAKRDEPLRVVWVANIKPMKRPEAFLDLAAALAGRTDTEFVMIGRAAHRRYQAGIEARLRDRPWVRYLGELSADRVNGILEQSHVFVNTSRAEGFPNTFIQAWMREVPVVSLEVDPDGVLGREGVGIRAGTPERLHEVVAGLLDDRGRREAMGRRARDYAVAAHGLDAHIGRLDDLLREVAR